MRKVGAEVASGIAIFLAIVIFVFGFLFLKNTAFKGGYELYVRFPDVTGLEPHDVVNLSGLRVGQVEGFELQDLNVVVRISVDEEVRLPADSRAYLKNLGLVGEKFIDIVPGTSSEYLDEGSYIQGAAEGDFASLTGSVEEVVGQAGDLLQKLLEAFDSVFDDATRQNLRESLLHLNRVSATLDDNSENFNQLLANLQSVSSNIDEMLTERRRQIEESITNLHSATGRLEGVLARMDSSLTIMQAVLAKIDNEEGTVGKVIASDELYNNMKQLQMEIDELLQDLKRRPQKYINMKVF